jgi:hypothetical protein
LQGTGLQAFLLNPLCSKSLSRRRTLGGILLNWLTNLIVIAFLTIFIIACVKYFKRPKIKRPSPNPFDVLEAAKYGREANAKPMIDSTAYFKMNK